MELIKDNIIIFMLFFVLFRHKMSHGMKTTLRNSHLYSPFVTHKSNVENCEKERRYNACRPRKAIP